MFHLLVSCVDICIEKNKLWLFNFCVFVYLVIFGVSVFIEGILSFQQFIATFWSAFCTLDVTIS